MMNLVGSSCYCGNRAFRFTSKHMFSLQSAVLLLYMIGINTNAVTGSLISDIINDIRGRDNDKTSNDILVSSTTVGSDTLPTATTTSPATTNVSGENTDVVNVIVTDLFLVNTIAGNDVIKMENDIIVDLKEYGTDLTIRANVQSKEQVQPNANVSIYVSFNLDNGQLQRIETGIPPYFLAGKDDTTNKPYPANTLSNVLGKHTITVIPSMTTSIQELLEVVASNNDIQYSAQQQQEQNRRQRQRRAAITKMEDSKSNEKRSLKSTGNLFERFRQQIFPSGSSGKSVGKTYRKVQAIQDENISSGDVLDGSISISFTIINSNNPSSTMPPTEGRATTVPNSTLSPISTPIPPVVSNKDDVLGYYASVNGFLNYPTYADTTNVGTINVWDKITLGFEGPFASETGSTERDSDYYRPSSTFADYRLDVTFTTLAPSDESSAIPTSFIVPGYFTAQGDVSNTGMSSGTVWLCHFRPNHPGIWNWTASFTKGLNVAQNPGSGDPAGYMHGSSGSLIVINENVIVNNENYIDPDIKSKRGRLGIHQTDSKLNRYRFTGNGEYFVKIGPGTSPINLLASLDDQNPTLSPHITDFVEGNPTWGGGKGKGTIGAINYLAKQGMNTIAVTTLDMQENLNPFATPTASIDDASFRFMSYDVSSLAQWGIILDWADANDFAIDIQLHSEFGDDDEIFYDPDEGNSGALYDSRRLYYREMIARFSHNMAITWVLGSYMSIERIAERSAYIRSIDPYENPIKIRMNSAYEEKFIQDIAKLPTVDAISVRNMMDPSDSSETVLQKMIQIESDVGSSVVVEIEAVIVRDPNNLDQIRQNLLWPTIMSGMPGGLLYNYFLLGEDFVTQNSLWDQSRYAIIDFFKDKTVPYWDMKHMNEIISEGSWCLSDSSGTVFVVYKKANTLSITLDLSSNSNATSVFSIGWFSPKLGGELSAGTITQIRPGVDVSLGTPRQNIDQDWVALVQCTNC